MPRAGYDTATRYAILKAVLAARDSGKSWKHAYVAGKKAGYKGSLGGVVQFVRKGSAGEKTGRRAGRRKIKTVAVPLKSNDLALLLENLVKTRVNAAHENAIAKLQGGISSGG